MLMGPPARTSVKTSPNDSSIPKLIVVSIITIVRLFETVAAGGQRPNSVPVHLCVTRAFGSGLALGASIVGQGTPTELINRKRLPLA